MKLAWAEEDPFNVVRDILIEFGIDFTVDDVPVYTFHKMVLKMRIKGQYIGSIYVYGDKMFYRPSSAILNADTDMNIKIDPSTEEGEERFISLIQDLVKAYDMFVWKLQARASKLSWQIEVVDVKDLTGWLVKCHSDPWHYTDPKEGRTAYGIVTKVKEEADKFYIYAVWRDSPEQAVKERDYKLHEACRSVPRDRFVEYVLPIEKVMSINKKAWVELPQTHQEQVKDERLQYIFNILDSNGFSCQMQEDEDNIDYVMVSREGKNCLVGWEKPSLGIVKEFWNKYYVLVKHRDEAFREYSGLDVEGVLRRIGEEIK